MGGNKQKDFAIVLPLFQSIIVIPVLGRVLLYLLVMYVCMLDV